MIELFGIRGNYAEILGQIISVIAMSVTVLSFQCKNRSRILLCQMAGNLLFLISYVMLGALSAVAMNVIFLVRNTVYLYKNKYKFLRSAGTVIFFCILCAAVGLLTAREPWDILTAVGALFGCVSLYMNDERQILAIKTGDSLCWLVYNSITFVTGGIICEVCNLISIAVGLLRLKKRNS